MDRLERATARRRGSGSATATSRRTCGGPTASAPGPARPTVALEPPAALGIAPTRPADGRRAGPDRGPDRRRLARVPGVLRPPAPGADRPRGPVRRHRGRPRRRPRCRGARPRPMSIVDRAVEPDRVDRADPAPCPASWTLLAAARRDGVPVVAVSGIIGGKALKGPADRMLASLGNESSALGVAARYAGGDRRVRHRRPSMPRSSPRSRRSGSPRSSPTRSWPTTRHVIRLAGEVLGFAAGLRGGGAAASATRANG